MPLPIAIYFAGLVLGIFLIPLASGVAVANLVAVSEKRRLRQSVLGFLVVAFSTSLPELLVAINAIIIGNMAVSLGDILGSNITNISLIVGLSLIVASLRNPRRPVTLEPRACREFVTGLMLLSTTLLALLYIQYIGRIIGILLLAVFIIYSYILIRRRRIDGEEKPTDPMDVRIRKELSLFILGLAGVIISARITLESAIEIATSFQIPASIIGATLIAFGTSLPELAVDIRAAYRGYLNLALGDIVGSCFLNSTLILGLLLTFTPFGVNIIVLSDLILFSVVSNLLLWYFIDTQRLDRNAGLVLLVLYIINVLSLLGILHLKANQ
jgi:cation:H+ antiporter